MDILQVFIMALAAVLPLILFSVFYTLQRENRSSWRAILGILVAVLIIISVAYWLMVDSNGWSSISILGSGAPYMINLLFVAISSFVPVIAYWIYINGVDSEKPEPLPILLLTVALGALAAITVIITGKPLFLGGFSSELTHGFVNSLQIGFLELAIPAELTKWLFIVVFLYLNRYYDEYIDGVVYSVCLSLGFAAVLGSWFIYDFVDYSFWIFFKKGLVTALVLIPLHFMSGSSMGYFLALARNKYKIVNHLGALATAIVIDGAVCTMLVMMGGEWGYYLIVGIVLTALSLAFYAQINHLLRLDKENK